MGGIRLRHLAFTGPDIETAELTFDDGLNIIYGASNTGKSFTAEAILFMLGVSKTLRETEEIVRYDGVWLGLTLPDKGDVTLYRSSKGGAFKLHQGLVTSAGADARFIMTDAELTYTNGTRKFGQQIRDGKITPVQPDAEMLNTLHAHQQREIEAMVANAPPGITDPQGAVDLYISLLQKWRKIVGDELGIKDVPSQAEEIVDAWFIDYDFGPYQRRLAEELHKARESLAQN